MAYLSDRMRVEICLPAHVMMSVVMAGASHRDKDFTNCVEWLAMASADGLRDLDEKRQAKLIARIRRVHHEISDPYTEEGGEVSRFGLIAFYWIKALVESDYLVFAEGSSIDKAMQIYMGALEHRASIPSANYAAMKQAVKLIGQLQAMGFYQDVEPCTPTKTLTIDDIEVVRV